MKRLTLILLLVLLPAILFAQIDSLIIAGKKQLDTAVNIWNEQKLLASRAFFERLQADSTYPFLIHYYIALADYRLTSYYFSRKDKENAKRFIEDGISHLQKSIELKEDFAESHSLLSSFYGNKIGVKPYLGIVLGPKSGKQMKKALQLEPKNPRNYLIAGISAYFTPRFFGGGKENAINDLQQAITYFDSVKTVNPIYPDWGAAEAHAWLGLIYKEKKLFDKAEQHYKKALQINPDYGWVKHVLLPDLKKHKVSK